MNQNFLRLKRRTKLFLLAFSIFSILFSGVISNSALLVQAAEEGTVQMTVYHQHTGSCYSMQRCGGAAESSDYFIYGCKCNLEHICPDHGCYWEEPNSLYPSGCWHCYCPKGTNWICTVCHRITPGTTCDNEVSKISCGKGGSATAYISVGKGTLEWCTQLELTADVELSGAELSDTPYIWDGAASDQNVYTVTENGTHTFELQADDNSNTKDAVVTIQVNNIDHTGPQIISYEQQPTSGWTKEPVKLIVTDIQDLQPDGSAGCGLAELPISFDGGEWTAERVFVCGDSGAYDVQLRDALGNVADAQVIVRNVDITGPAVNFEWDQTPNLTEVTVNVLARDEQKDGSDGCGLAALPYSYDGGATWTDKTTFEVAENGSYTVLVKDMMGNVTEATVEITNLDKTGPEVEITVTPEDWNGEGSVTITVEAVDEGSGLEDAPYSWDGGQTFTDEAVREVEEAGDYTVIVKDKNGNITECTVTVTKQEPVKPDSGNSGSGSNSGGSSGNDGSGSENGGNSGSDNGNSGSGNAGSSDSDTSGSGNAGSDGDQDSNASGLGDGTGNDGDIDGEENAANGDDSLNDDQTKSSAGSKADSGNKKTNLKDKNAGNKGSEKGGIKKSENGGLGTAIDADEENEGDEDRSGGAGKDNSAEEMMEMETVKADEALAAPSQSGTRLGFLQKETVKAVTIAASSALLLSVAGLFFFLLLMGVRVYDDKGNGKFRLMGMRICRRSEGSFLLLLPRSMTEKSETGHFRLCPGAMFAVLNQDEEMLVESEEEQCQISVKISKKMEIRL